MTTLAMIHTGPVVIAPLNRIAKSEMNGVRIVNLMDDSIVSEIERTGEIGVAVRNRMRNLARSAVEAGADAALVTCSSISELTEEMAAYAGIPVYKIDEAMAEKAVQIGSNIAVVATLPTTLRPTCGQIERKAAEFGKDINLTQELCREAFDRLSSGDEKGHDELILGAIERLAFDNDVVVLAQASMARFGDRLKEMQTPVLTSPQLGISRVREILAAVV